MPESSTAIRAATTEPAPARSVYKLDMSDRTPILITLSEICACAPAAASAVVIASASMLRFIDFMVDASVERKIAKPSDAQILVQLAHVPVELGVRDHVDDAPVLHHVMPIGDG